MLNQRLLACANFVRQNAHVCDVGTDHAQLPVYLIEKGIAETAIASDIVPKPLQSAERTISAHGLGGIIHTILSDGLKQVPPEGLTDIVIAGMGGETIIHILENCPFPLEDMQLIFQPMTKAETLREWLYLNGFDIAQETFVKDGKFIYVIMCARKTGVVHAPSVKECWFGKADFSTEEGYAYIVRQSERLRKQLLHKNCSIDWEISGLLAETAELLKEGQPKQ